MKGSGHLSSNNGLFNNYPVIHNQLEIFIFVFQFLWKLAEDIGHIKGEVVSG